MLRFFAILIFYLIVLGALSALLYLIVPTAIVQVTSLSDYVRFLLTPMNRPSFSSVNESRCTFMTQAGRPIS